MQRKITLPGTFYSQQGPRAVLLLHAYSGSPNDVRMLSRFLEKHDYTVYAPLFQGHGTLEPLDILAQNPQAWLEDTRQALNFLQAAGHRQIAVFGLSMGGIFAMDRLTDQQLEIIGGGAFCSPLFSTENQVPMNFLLYARQVYQTAGKSSAEIEARLPLLQEKIQQQLQAITEFGEQTANKLPDISVPVFLAQAGQDEMIDPMTVFQTSQQLIQTRFELQWYPNSGHVITVDPSHQRFERDVLAFLATLPWNEELT